MALIKFGPTISEARKSIGGVTFARNRAGAYIRKRTKPVNPSSPSQVKIRDGAKWLQQHWRDTLTWDQRQSFMDLAAASPMKNRLGESQAVTPINMYTRLNNIRKYFGVAALDTAPSTPAVCDLPAMTFSGSVLHGVRVESITPVIPAGAYLYCFTSAKRPQTRNFWKGPYANTRLVDSTTAVPFELVPPSGVAIGDRFFFRIRFQDVDGRLSTNYYGHVDVNA
jgi:hypothetical protein